MFPAHERNKTKYVGREREFSLLDSMLNEVKGGHGRLVMVEGEAGIGKTRFTEEMRNLPAFEGFSFLWGRCLYFKDTDTYLPFKEMFNQYVKLKGKTREGGAASPFSSGEDMQIPRDDDFFREEEFVPMSLIPAEIDTENVESGMVVEGLLRFDKLSEFIFNLAAEEPLCLLIDDLHWADPPSLQLLQYLAQKIPNQTILIICTYRPEDLFWGKDKSHPLADALKRMEWDKLYTPIPLNRLNKTEVMEILKNILSVEEVPPDFLNLIYQRTMGNPFFVEEVLYSMIERDIIDVTDPSGFEKLDPSKISLPTTLRDVILRRVHWLKPASIKAVRFASVAGKDFNFEVMRDSLDLSEEEIIGSLEELVLAKFIVEGDEEELYEFENPVIQEVIYSELNHSRRRFLHNKMANVLEKKYAEKPGRWAEVAIHYYKAKDFQNALTHLIRAASYFQNKMPKRSLDYLHMVLDCNERLPLSEAVKERNMEVYLEISNLCLEIYDLDRSMEFAEKAIHLSTVLKKPLTKIKAKNNMGELFSRAGKYEESIKWFEEAMEMAREREDSEGLARSYVGIGYIDWRKGDYSKALERFSKSLQYAKAENNLETIGRLYLNIGNLFNHRGDLKKAVDYYERGIRHLESCGQVIDTIRGYSNLGNTYLQLSDYNLAGEYLSKSIILAKEKGLINWWPYINMIEHLSLKGEYDKVEIIYQKVIEDLVSRGEKLERGIATMYMGSSRSRQGRTEDASNLLDEAISIFEELGVPYDLGRAKLRKGEHLLGMDMEEEARDQLTEAYGIFREIGARLMEERAKGLLAKMTEIDDYL